MINVNLIKDYYSSLIVNMNRDFTNAKKVSVKISNGEVFSLPLLQNDILSIDVDFYFKSKDKNLKNDLLVNKFVTVCFKITYSDFSEINYYFKQRIYNKSINTFISSLSFDLYLLLNFKLNLDTPIIECNLSQKANNKNNKFLFIKNLLNRILNRFFIRDEWLILFAKERINPKQLHENFNKFISLGNDKGYFNADPFLFKKDDNYYIFYEKCKLLRGKGILVAKNIKDNKEFPILEENYHLSYPNVFEYQNKIYLIPQGDNFSVDLYECTSFPNKWRKIHTLIKSKTLHFADTNIYVQKNDIKITTSIYSHAKDSNRCLLEWNISNLLNANLNLEDAIITRIGDEGSRNAGNLKDSETALYQGCAISYGENLINKEDLYVINPPKGYSGIHTYNTIDNITIIDLKKKKYGLFF